MFDAGVGHFSLAGSHTAVWMRTCYSSLLPQIKCEAENRTMTWSVLKPLCCGSVIQLTYTKGVLGPGDPNCT